MRKLIHEEVVNRQKNRNKQPRLPFAVVLNNIRSLYNVGSIFRTSDGAMIQKLILTGYTPYPPRKEIEKTALGSTKSVKWEYFKDPLEAIQLLKEQGIKLCCLELTDKSIPHYNVQPSDFPLCLVIGNEIVGVSTNIISLCDMAVEIPMYGIKQSLNVAVAYGVAVFELTRIWRIHNGIVE